MSDQLEIGRLRAENERYRKAVQALARELVVSADAPYGPDSEDVQDFVSHLVLADRKARRPFTLSYGTLVDLLTAACETPR